MPSVPKHTRFDMVFEVLMYPSGSVMRTTFVGTVRTVHTNPDGAVYAAVVRCAACSAIHEYYRGWYPVDVGRRFRVVCPD